MQFSKSANSSLLYSFIVALRIRKCKSMQYSDLIASKCYVIIVNDLHKSHICKILRIYVDFGPACLESLFATPLTSDPKSPTLLLRLAITHAAKFLALQVPGTGLQCGARIKG